MLALAQEEAEQEAMEEESGMAGHEVSSRLSAAHMC